MLKPSALKLSAIITVVEELCDIDYYICMLLYQCMFDPRWQVYGVRGHVYYMIIAVEFD